MQAQKVCIIFFYMPHFNIYTEIKEADNLKNNDRILKIFHTILYNTAL